MRSELIYISGVELLFFSPVLGRVSLDFKKEKERKSFFVALHTCQFLDEKYLHSGSSFCIIMSKSRFAKSLANILMQQKVHVLFLHSFRRAADEVGSML